MTAAMMVAAAGAAQAERIVMVTHDNGHDSWWAPVIQGAKDAAAATGVELEYIPNPSEDNADMAKLIETAAATQPDGMIVSLPDPAAVGPAVKSVVASGIPVVTFNSGLEASKELGALMHVGQPERLAGKAAGERAKSEGVTKAICLNHGALNTALTQRCEGYFEGLGLPLNMIDVSSDVAQMKVRTSAALDATPDLNGMLATGPQACEAAAAAADEVGVKAHLACFDLSPGLLDLIKGSKVAFTIDQQPYLQGYMPVIVLHLNNQNAGLLPGADIPSGPGFVDAKNADAVAALAGKTR
jgi:simple sugar transport system substrate-binding protein